MYPKKLISHSKFKSIKPFELSANSDQLVKDFHRIKLMVILKKISHLIQSLLTSKKL